MHSIDRLLKLWNTCKRRMSDSRRTILQNFSRWQREQCHEWALKSELHTSRTKNEVHHIAHCVCSAVYWAPCTRQNLAFKAWVGRWCPNLRFVSVCSRTILLFPECNPALEMCTKTLMGCSSPRHHHYHTPPLPPHSLPTRAPHVFIV